MDVRQSYYFRETVMTSWLISLEMHCIMVVKQQVMLLNGKDNPGL